MKNITKADFYEKLKEHFGLQFIETKVLTDELINTLIELISNNQEVILKNFGLFKKVVRKEKKIYSPSKKEYINIPEKKILKFFNKKNFLKK